MKWMLIAASVLAPAFAYAEDCKVAIEGDSPIAQACRDGGRDAAKKLMKDLVKRAKAAGDKSYDCGRCHKSTRSYELKEGARDALSGLLEKAR